MIAGGRVLGLVPARGGSIGVPRKNLRQVGGRPLLAWTADAARGSAHLDRVVLSTDDEAIAAAGRAVGLEVPFMRPAALATSTATAADVVLHTLDALPGERFDYLVYLQPTSPLRTSADIDACLEALVAAGADTDACVSVEATSPPEWTYRMDGGGRLTPVVGAGDKDASRRQDLAPAYALSGAVYVARVEAFRRLRTFVGPATIACVMPAERSIDIDDEGDLRLADALLRARP